MNITRTFVRLAGVGVLMFGMAALIVVLAPEARGQSTRSEPFSVIRTQLMGGSHIGATVRDVDDADVRREGLSTPAGAVIEEIRRDSPAADAGFKAGDVVVTFDGERVRSARHLMRLIEETPDGREVTATVVRASERHELTVAPETPEPFSLATQLEPLRELRSFNLEVPDIELPGTLHMDPERFYLLAGRSPARLGVEVSDLTDQLAEHFGAESGVLVASVDDDTPAARAGLQAGDVITRVAGEQVRSTSELRRRLSENSGEVTIDIVRDRRAETLRADIGDGPSRRIRR
jgi:serine protease Do